MSKVALAPERAVSSHLPLVTDPRLPIGWLLHHSPGGRGSIVSPTANCGRETDGHALPRLGLLIMQECASFAVGAALLGVELLAVAALVRPAPLRATSTTVPSHDAARGHDGDLVLLPLLRGLLVCGHDLLPIGRRLAELLHAMCEVAVGDVGAGPGPELAAELGLEEHLADGAGLARAVAAPAVAAASSSATAPGPAARLLARRRLLAPRPRGGVPVAVAGVVAPLAVVVLGGPDGGVPAGRRRRVGPGIRAGSVRDDVDGVGVVHPSSCRPSKLWGPNPTLRLARPLGEGGEEEPSQTTDRRRSVAGPGIETRVGLAKNFKAESST
jgi:hypothetical protein